MLLPSVDRGGCWASLKSGEAGPISGPKNDVTGEDV